MSLVVDVKEDDNDEKGDIPLPNTTPLPLHRRATWEVVEKEDNNDEFGLSAFEMTKRSVTSAPSVMAFGLNNNNLKDEDSTIVKNKSHSVKRSILNKFMPITFTLLSLVALCTITIVFFSNRFILNQTYAMLRDQYSRYGGIIAQRESAAIAAVMSWTGVELEAGMTCDFYRTDYAVGKYTMSLGCPEYLVDSSRDTKYPSRNVSLAHSSYVYPNLTCDNVPNLTSSQQNNRDTLSKIDPIAKSIYDIRMDTLQSFFALEEDGMFLIYPGLSMERNSSAIDWRKRDWYIQGKNSLGETIITEPYVDYFTNEYVVSLVRSVSNVETGSFVGVFGLDILVDTFRKYVTPAYNMDRELVFFVSTGRILLDSDWNFSTSNFEEFNYETISSPAFSDSDWSKIQSSLPGETKNLVTSDSFYCYTFRFDEPLDEFVFVACADEETLLEQSSELELVMTKDWEEGLAIVIATSILLVILTLSVFYCTVSSLAREVDKTYKKINDLFYELRRKAEENRVDELLKGRLAMNLEALAHVDKNGEELAPAMSPTRPLSRLFSQSDAYNANPFWNKKHPFLHHHEVSERFLTRPPHTPPPSGHWEKCDSESFARHFSPTSEISDFNLDFDDSDYEDESNDESDGDKSREECAYSFNESNSDVSDPDTISDDEFFHGSNEHDKFD